MTVQEDIGCIVAQALAEDIGRGDVTSELTIAKSARAEMKFIAGEPLVACGLFVLEEVYRQLGGVKTQVKIGEGRQVKKGAVLAVATGNARALLAGERVALNFVQRMSGVATLTRQYVKAVRGTKARILDTRKTMPGLRILDKYAVRAGGGQNHRMRLDDMVLIKDNHLGGGGQGSGIGEIIIRAKSALASLIPDSRSPIPIIVECDTLAQVKEALTAKPDRILLDNMRIAELKKAVKLAGGKIALEASGGVSLKNVGSIAKTGVRYISVGRLTHSAPAADIRADIRFIKGRS